MNKKELIESISHLPSDCSRPRPMIDKLTALELIKLLDEPQKVQVPQFVADYIDFKKTYDFHVYGAMRVIEDHYDKRVQEWFYEGNIETFARAWLDGYEVEKEKYYKIEVKGVSENSTLIHDITEECWFFEDDNNEDPIHTYHTRKELEEAGFGWVFDCDGMEVKEVQDDTKI